jgi:hypothetical protein
LRALKSQAIRRGSQNANTELDHGGPEVRCRPAIRLAVAAGRLAAALTIMTSLLSHAEALKPADALERYLAARRNEQPACAESLFAVQIDASLPALKKTGRMTGFKWMAQPGQAVYRGLRFTGDKFVKTRRIRFQHGGQSAQ